MRVIQFDIDTLRADHLGCYGYGRETSPVIDEISQEAIRFTNVYASDTPCLPSRTALSSGRFGTNNGVVGHGGTSADPFSEGADRGFRSSMALRTWAASMQGAGMWTASISTFPERHSAFHFLAGFNESFNLGTRGIETADQVSEVARDWLRRNGHRDSWFLHVHLWDPHTPYRTPESFGEPFEGEPYPSWLTEEVRREHWRLPGPHSAQEISGFGPRSVWDEYPRQPQSADSADAIRRMFDGYDTGIRYADHHVGLIMQTLESMDLRDEVAIIITSDHGESLGELGIYCDHQTADESVARVPMILRWPGLTGTGPKVDTALHYQFDVAASVLELLGVERPLNWDGRSFARDLGAGPAGASQGRESLVLTHGAWTAQRAVRFENWICIWTYHDGFHGFPAVMLFDVESDPHEVENLAPGAPEVVGVAEGHLEAWLRDIRGAGDKPEDPLLTVLAEGGPWHSLVGLSNYDRRLQETGRGKWIDQIGPRNLHQPQSAATAAIDVGI